MFPIIFLNYFLLEITRASGRLYRFFFTAFANRYWYEPLSIRYLYSERDLDPNRTKCVASVVSTMSGNIENIKKIWSELCANGTRVR